MSKGYLITSNYISTLYKYDGEFTDGTLEIAVAKNIEGFQTLTPQEYELDVRDGWVSPEEWVYVDTTMESSDFVGYVRLDSVHPIEDVEELEDEYGPSVNLN